MNRYSYLTLFTYCILIELLLLMCGAGLLGAAEVGGGRPELDQARRSLHELETRVRIARSVDEFVSDIDLFDNQLYGRAKSGSLDEAGLKSLHGDIQAKNTELDRLMNNPPDEIRNGGVNLVTQDTQNFYESVYGLENEIAGLLVELKTLESGAAGSTPTELLDGSMWREEAGHAVLNPGGEDLKTVLDSCRKLVRELEAKEKKDSGAAGPADTGTVKPE